MNELLQKLLEAEILTPETKKALDEAVKAHLDEATKKAKEDAEIAVRAELTETWVTERDALIEAIDSKVGEYLTAEISELKDGIESFRDLEAEYAEKIVETKAQMSNELKGDMAELVEKLDAFLELRLTAELSELNENISEVRRLDFGRRMFEAFKEEYAENHMDPYSAEAKARALEEELSTKVKELDIVTKKHKDIVRKVKMDKVLSPLKGKHKEVMEAILKNVDTESLEEAYKTFIGRVLKEDGNQDTSEKETPVLAEGKSENKKDKKEAVVFTKTGDNEDLLREAKEEHEANNQLSSDARGRLRRMAGIGE
jgi:hypothetical protein